MGCQSSAILGKNLVFSIACHDPDTGELTDADSAPIYRVYEDETGTPILTGTMTTLDAANTTGFYTESIACTAGNGFEVDKSYTVYIEATVDGDTGGISYGFAVTPVLSNITAADVWTADGRRLTEGTVPTDPVVSGNVITVYRGTSWTIPVTDLGAIDTAGGDVLYFTVKTKRSDTDANALLQVRVGGADPGLVRFNAANATRGNGSIEITDAADGDVIVHVEESVTTGAVPSSLLRYDFKLVAGGDVDVLVPGIFIVRADVTRAIG